MKLMNESSAPVKVPRSNFNELNSQNCFKFNMTHRKCVSLRRIQLESSKMKSSKTESSEKRVCSVYRKLLLLSPSVQTSNAWLLSIGIHPLTRPRRSLSLLEQTSSRQSPSMPTLPVFETIYGSLKHELKFLSVIGTVIFCSSKMCSFFIWVVHIHWIYVNKCAWLLLAKHKKPLLLLKCFGSTRDPWYSFNWSYGTTD